MTEESILDVLGDVLGRFASTPKDSGRYPSDDECDSYEQELRMT